MNRISYLGIVVAWSYGVFIIGAVQVPVYVSVIETWHGGGANLLAVWPSATPLKLDIAVAAFMTCGMLLLTARRRRWLWLCGWLPISAVICAAVSVGRASSDDPQFIPALAIGFHLLRRAFEWSFPPTRVPTGTDADGQAVAIRDHKVTLWRAANLFAAGCVLVQVLADFWMARFADTRSEQIALFVVTGAVLAVFLGRIRAFAMGRAEHVVFFSPSVPFTTLRGAVSDTAALERHLSKRNQEQ